MQGSGSVDEIYFSPASTVALLLLRLLYQTGVVHHLVPRRAPRACTNIVPFLYTSGFTLRVVCTRTYCT